MKEHYERASEELVGVNGFWTDLVGAALSDVNWREISQHWIEAELHALGIESATT